MAEDLQQRIDRLMSKADLLVQRYNVMKQAREEAEERVSELQQKLSDLERQLSLKDTEIERLKISSVLSPDHKDVEATRAFLSGLVREIDKSIAQLSI